MKISILLFVGLLLLPWAVRADLYKWIDANGKVHYSDKDPNAPIDPNEGDNVPVAESEVFVPDHDNVISADEAGFKASQADIERREQEKIEQRQKEIAARRAAAAADEPSEEEKIAKAKKDVWEQTKKERALQRASTEIPSH